MSGCTRVPWHLVVDVEVYNKAALCWGLIFLTATVWACSDLLPPPCRRPASLLGTVLRARQVKSMILEGSTPSIPMETPIVYGEISPSVLGTWAS